MTKERIKKISKWTAVSLIFAAALVIGVRASFLANGRIAPGVSAAGIKLGGMTKEEAEIAAAAWASKRLSQPLVFQVGSRRWVGLLREMGVRLDTKAMVQDAYGVGRTGGFVKRLRDVFLSSFGTMDIPPRYRFDRTQIAAILDKINDAVGTPAKNARISFENGVRVIYPEAPGTTIDFDQAGELIEETIRRGEPLILLPIVEDTPDVTAKDLEPIDTLLARFTTRYQAWRRDRTHNLVLAAERINGTLLKPGEVFSYNDTVGPRKRSTGFKDALIYVRGKIITGTGGGVCQVSSTLYNAALLAGLDVLERHNHSMPVPYVPLGRDATVAFGARDLKIKNTADHPIYIRLAAGRGRVTAEVYGSSADKKDVRIIVTRPKKIARAGAPTITAVSVYRVIACGGEEKREQLSYDRYLPPAPHPEDNNTSNTQNVAAAGARTQ